MLGSYYKYPGVNTNVPVLSGLGSDATAAVGTSLLTWAIFLPIRLASGYFVGRYFKHPIAGAIIGTLFGVPGLAVLAAVSDRPQTALSNRRRRRSHRRGRR